MKTLRLMMAAALLAFATLFAIAPAQAQQQVHICMFSVGANGSNNCQDITASFPFPVTASVTISGFAPSASGSVGTPISVTTGGVSGTLPTGAEVIASNAGATNTAYCQLGASATTSSQPIPPNSWFSFTVGSATQLTCITSASTTTVNMIGGAGLATGAGGGGGGGSGGSVNLTQVGGSNITLGTATAAASLPVALPTATITTLTPPSNTGYALSANQTNATQKTQIVDGSGNVIASTNNALNINNTNSTLLTPTLTSAILVKGTTSAMTGTTSTQVIAAVSAQRIYVMSIHCNNSSATASLVTIQDGSGGTALDTLAANSTYGGEDRNGGGVPMFWTTAGNALFAADVTTGASVICQASGYSSAN